MKKFIVHIKEIWNQPVEVEAKNEDGAIQEVAEGNGKYLKSEYDYTEDDTNDWEVEEK